MESAHVILQRRGRLWPRRVALPLVLMPAAIVAVGLFAYHTSFAGAWLFDDEAAIVGNPHIRHLWPLTEPLQAPADSTLIDRPVASLSFALNYAIGGLDIRGYHAVNLAIHLAAALALFGLIRRALRARRRRARDRHRADWIALAATLIWTVHPLQTESVTYVVQRVESLAGLFYLLTLYAVARAAAAPLARRWPVLAIAACALGMATKETVVTAPLVALLYDGTCFASSWRDAWRRRRAVYLGLASTWLVALLLQCTPPSSARSAGFGYHGLSPLDYARMQPQAILRYLRLAWWPSGLCFDYGWLYPPVGSAWWPAAAVVGMLLAATGWLLARRAGVGFLGASMWLILLPTSSVVPLADAVVEHRMYLPLAAVAVLAVVGAERLWSRAPLRGSWRGAVAAVTGAVVVAALAMQTIHRNADYRSPEAMWADTVATRPANPRAHNNLGRALAARGALIEAAAQFREALRLHPGYGDAWYNLGLALARHGEVEQAIACYREALQRQPDDAPAHNNLGVALASTGKLDEALAEYREALRIDPGYRPARQNLSGLAMRTTEQSPVNRLNGD